MFDIGTFWLKINYFFLSRKDDLKKWWVIVLIAIDIFIIVFVFTNSIIFLIGISKQNQLMVAIAAESVDYQAIREQNKPQSLEVVSTTALLAPNNKYDLVSLVRNNNKNWAMTSIDFKFIINGTETDLITDFILPDSEKYLTALGVGESGLSESADISMEIVGVEWKRVVHPEQIKADDFIVENIEYTPSVVNELTIYRIRADVVNSGYKSYWKTKFVVVLYSGEKIVGINYVYFDQFNAGERRSLYTQWESVPLTVSGLAILPDFNLLDDKNIIK